MTEYKIPLTKDGRIDYREMSYRPVSRMLDNPSEYDIYPTSECYKELDNHMKALVTHVVEECAKVARHSRSTVHAVEEISKLGKELVDG